MVELPNIIALFLSISDKSLNNAKTIFRDKLESDIKYIIRPDEKNYFEYGIENSNSYVFDLLEELFISVVFAYTAVEATVNNLIPNWFFIIKVDRKRKVIDDKYYIERYYNLKSKIKDILPLIYKFDTDFDKLDFWEPFTKLEKFRNELIHYKSEEMKSNESIQIGILTDIIFSLIKFDIIESARKLIKYLSDNIKLLPGLPYEFSSKPINIKVLQQFYSEKNLSEKINELSNDLFNKKITTSKI